MRDLIYVQFYVINYSSNIAGSRVVIRTVKRSNYLGPVYMKTSVSPVNWAGSPSRDKSFMSLHEENLHPG